MDQLLQAKICDLVTPLIEAVGLELWGCELIGDGHRKLVRIYIDSAVGVTLDDCAKISHQIGGIFDVEDFIPAKYLAIFFFESRS